MVGGGFVSLRAKSEACVLASKATFDGDLALVQAIHDASSHLGARRAVCQPDDGMKDGADDGANRAAALRLQQTDAPVKELPPP